MHCTQYTVKTSDWLPIAYNLNGASNQLLIININNFALKNIHKKTTHLMNCLDEDKGSSNSNFPTFSMWYKEERGVRGVVLVMYHTGVIQ